MKPASTCLNSERRIATGAERRLATLKSREIQVLTLVGEGKRTKEIAFELGIAFKTVVAYRLNIKEKLGIHELVVPAPDPLAPASTRAPRNQNRPVQTPALARAMAKRGATGASFPARLKWT